MHADEPEPPRRRALDATWETIHARAPTVASELEALRLAREQQLAAYSEGSRIAGIEQLFAFLNAASKAYEQGPELLQSAKRLVDRAYADFVTALDATLAGLLAVALDSMRDILEIEMLMLDFVAEPEHLERWLTCTEKERRGFFAPGRVRARLRVAGVGEVTSSVFGTDYAAHSHALHVNPHERPLDGKKAATDEWKLDAGFWEIFEHARRLFLAVEGLRFRAHDGADLDPLGPLDAFWDAHARVQQMQEMYLAFLEAPARLHRDLNREPTTVEILEFVQKRLIDRLPPSRDLPEAPADP
jgi:hypothetical protein